MSRQTQIAQVLEMNQHTRQYGLTLSKEEAALLAEERVNTLKQEQRIEFGQSILPKIIYAFCDSSYIMQEQFEHVCCGDFGYLEGTCLDIFAQAVRAGYSGYISSGGRGEFEKFDITTRWNKELYLETLRELAWR